MASNPLTHSASVLGALDDKIELNTKMSAALEAIARALFKSWFVDFDPVRAKAEGRDPSLPQEIAALFPDAFEDSELGPIPQGWQAAPLRKLSALIRRGISPGYSETGVLVVNQKCIRNGTLDFSKARRHDPSSKAVEARTLAVGDVLINSTGVGTLGRVAPVINLPSSQITYDSHVTLVRPDPLTVGSQYFGASLLHIQPEIEQLGEGTTGQTELSRDRLGALTLLYPPRLIQDCFGGLVGALFARCYANTRQSETLAILRDMLLPKLISGEIRVTDAERIVEKMA